MGNIAPQDKPGYESGKHVNIEGGKHRDDGQGHGNEGVKGVHEQADDHEQDKAKAAGVDQKLGVGPAFYLYQRKSGHPQERDETYEPQYLPDERDIQ
jgi:hypothetical protein